LGVIVLHHADFSLSVWKDKSMAKTQCQNMLLLFHATNDNVSNTG